MKEHPFREVWQRRELIYNLVVRDMKVRYRGSVLGFLWTLLTPLFMAMIYIFFLRLLAGRRPPIEYEQIIIGVFAWTFTVQTVNGGMFSVLGNASLVKKVFFPRVILPLSVTISNLVNYLLSLVVQLPLVILLLWGKGEAVSGWIVLLPLVILYHFLFNLALALLVSAANVMFRDTEHLVGLLLSAWFFMSPVMYPMSLVDRLAEQWPWVGTLYMLNPLSVILSAYRAVQLPYDHFAWSAGSILGLVWPMLFLVAMYIFFQRKQRYFSDIL